MTSVYYKDGTEAHYNDCSSFVKEGCLFINRVNIGQSQLCIPISNLKFWEQE